MFQTVAGILGQDPDWSLLRPKMVLACIDWADPAMSEERIRDAVRTRSPMHASKPTTRPRRAPEL